MGIKHPEINFNILYKSILIDKKKATNLRDIFVSSFKNLNQFTKEMGWVQKQLLQIDNKKSDDFCAYNIQCLDDFC